MNGLCWTRGSAADYDAWRNCELFSESIFSLTGNLRAPGMSQEHILALPALLEREIDESDCYSRESGLGVDGLAAVFSQGIRIGL